MREIHDHKTNAANEELEIVVADEPGPGGANHLYCIQGFDATSNESLKMFEYFVPKCHCAIVFQNGQIKENGVNGITQEALLAIVIDRLRSFQAGPFACMENQMALMFTQNALEWLKFRTTGRVRRGVEGTHQQ